MVPAPDGGDDFVWICGPNEGLRPFVVLGQEAVDGGLKVDEGMKDAAFEASVGEFCEEALDGIEPGARRWCKVEGKARVPVEPLADLWVLVSGIVVEDHMDCFAGWGAGFDQIEKRMNSWWRWRCMLRPITVPSSTLSAAKSVVVPLRL